MNYKRQIERLESEMDSAISAMDKCYYAYKAAKAKTEELLTLCAEKGITKVSIGMRHKSVPSSDSWPFGAHDSVFTFAPAKNETDGFPAIWNICSQIGVGAGCGNADQKQVKSEMLIDGVYHLKSGQWMKVD